MALLIRSGMMTSYRAMASKASPAALRSKIKEHAGGGMRLWKILSFTVAVPGVLVCWLNARLTEQEEHESHERPDFIPYDHLRRRTKKWPWGDGNHSLFHNKETNPLPDGYEEEEE